ncbi:hypothetical protein FLAN108750_07195 [Flavobacterium antarcticum]|uniref:hypothetical protein n=1 Tax=Flavobacterium antarcticum TaxID=271155 RepID=UPI0003B549F6|nr:hypothetical protein [Flavobacterium antarcticum]
MKIFPPELEIVGDKVILRSKFETNHYSDILWYEFDMQLKDDIVFEQSDAFVVGLLLLALKLGEDIYVVGTISARLKYQLNHYLIPALCLAFKEFVTIKIYAEHENEQIVSKHSAQAATGISCGIDSFATLIEHAYIKTDLKIAYLTYLNAGSHSDYGGKYGRNVFKMRSQRISRFAKEIKLPLVKVDTNLSDLLKMKFVSTHTLRNMSCILNLQKSIKTYYYASAFRFDTFEINNLISDKYDLLTLQMISTESTKFYSSLSDKTREERTSLVSNYRYAFDYLDVCVDPTNAKGKINCSKCEKCMRTQVTLDVLGRLEDFNKVFNNEFYILNKSKYIGKLLANKNNSLVDKNVLSFLIENDFRITASHQLERYIYNYIRWKNSLKAKLKKYLSK